VENGGWISKIMCKSLLTDYLRRLWALRQQHFFPTLGAMHVAGTQLPRQAVALAVKQQQEMIAGGLEVTVELNPPAADR
jgi:hypothetical protein